MPFKLKDLARFTEAKEKPDTKTQKALNRKKNRTHKALITKGVINETT